MPNPSSSIFPPEPATFTELVEQIPGKYAVDGAVDRAGAAMIINRLRKFDGITISMLTTALGDKQVSEKDVSIIVEAYEMFVR